MKLTVTPADGDDKAQTLEDLARLIEGAHTNVRSMGGDPSQVHYRMVVGAVDGKAKRVELSW